MVKLDAIVPSERDRLAAEMSVRQLASIQDPAGVIDLHGPDGASASVTLPAGVLRLLKDLLAAMARGEVVTLYSNETILTTVQAAEFLQVSRPHLTKLLKQGDIPYHMVGSHRRIRFEDLVAFKAQQESARRDVLQELTDQAVDLDMGY